MADDELQAIRARRLAEMQKQQQGQQGQQNQVINIDLRLKYFTTHLFIYWIDRMDRKKKNGGNKKPT